MKGLPLKFPSDDELVEIGPEENGYAPSANGTFDLTGTAVATVSATLNGDKVLEYSMMAGSRL